MDNLGDNTCQVKMHDAKPCGKPRIDQHNCICHSSTSNKDRKLFKKELEAIFEDKATDIFDLTNFVFLPDHGFDFPNQIGKEIVFNRAMFRGKQEFADITFLANAIFGAARFEQDATFNNVVFTRDAYFVNTRFHGKSNFAHMEIKEQANFCEVIFQGDSIFNEIEFAGNTLFTRSSFQSAVTFENIVFAADTVFHMVHFDRLVIRQSNFLKEVLFHDASFHGNFLFINVILKSESNFESALFGAQADFFYCNFDGKATFNRARYKGNVSFDNVKFRASADLTYCSFFAELQLKDSNFGDSVSFQYTAFHSLTRFIHTVFDGYLNFSRCWLDKDAALLFDGDEPEFSRLFNRGANFSNMALGDPGKLIFRKISLERCRFLETDISKAKFIDVEWDTKKRGSIGKLGITEKMAVYDELTADLHWVWWQKLPEQDKTIEKEPKKFQFALIAQIYRRLQANYLENYRYSEAGEFFIGEREMMRKSKGEIRQYLCADFLYKIFSLYGESFLLPLAWLLLLLLVFPSLFLYCGINLTGNFQAPLDVEIVNYDWSWDPVNLLFFKNDYWKAFGVNISFITFNRAETIERLAGIGDRVLVSVEMLLVIIFVTFFLLALRRRFKRKSF